MHPDHFLVSEKKEGDETASEYSEASTASTASRGPTFSTFSSLSKTSRGRYVLGFAALFSLLQQRNQQRQKRKQRLTAKEGSMYEEEYLIQSLKQIIPTSKYQGMSPMEVNDSLDDFRGHWCGYQSTLVL